MKRILTGTALLASAFVGPTLAEDKPAHSFNEVVKSATKEEAQGLKIGYTTMDLTNQYFIEVARGMEDRAKELGIKLTVHDGKSDAGAQISAVENFISLKLDGIIVAPIAPEAMVPVVEEAKKAGIKVINSPQPIPNADAWFSLDEFEYGKKIGDIAGKYITEMLGGNAQVAVLTFPEISSLIPRGEGIKAGLKEFAPNAEIVAEQSALTPDKGATVAEAILQAHPGVEVFVGVNDAGVLGAFEAVSATKVSDKMAMFGLDATEEAVKKIKQGGMYKGTVDIAPHEIGRSTIDLAVQVIRKGAIEGLIKYPKMEPITNF